MVEIQSSLGIQKMIHGPLLNTLQIVLRVFVPIIHDKKTHFSLLCLDLDADGWYHMNPLKPQRANGKDEYSGDAKKMVSEEVFTDCLISCASEKYKYKKFEYILIISVLHSV